ncbi:hypothetical protein C2S51_034678 [Perilla frutescens var. frutescens]|nr:hypothetical protein C2S51_034678 [Perilla frutescens var. frutescens]
MLRSPLRSCKSKDQISDVVSSQHRRNHHQLVELLSPLSHSPAAEETHFTTKKTAASFLSPDANGRKCPPASPIISPLNNFKKNPKNKKKRRSITYRKRAGFQDRFPDCKYINGLFYDDDDDEDEDEEEAEEEKWRMRRRAAAVAVVKRSSDPYNDFRKSMMEMIVEKHIFAAKDLENLLRCFLSLNSYHHHKVIIQVFAEIWEACFCDPI